MKKNQENRPSEVFAGTSLHATLLKSMLENEEIEAYLKDEFTGIIAPWHSSPGGAGAVKVFVSGEDYEKARIVVSEFERNLNSD